MGQDINVPSTQEAPHTGFLQLLAYPEQSVRLAASMPIMRPGTAPTRYLVHVAMTGAVLGTACTPPEQWFITPDRHRSLLSRRHRWQISNCDGETSLLEILQLFICFLYKSFQQLKESARAEAPHWNTAVCTCSHGQLDHLQTEQEHLEVKTITSIIPSNSLGGMILSGAYVRGGYWRSCSGLFLTCALALSAPFNQIICVRLPLHYPSSR